jgi:predicted amidohydrolase
LSLDRGGLEVVDIHGEEPGARLTIIQLPLIHYALSLNLDNVRRVLRLVEKTSVKTVILPPFMPFGVSSISDREAAESISINRRNPYVRVLKHIVQQYRLNLISPYVFEKARGGFYASNLFIDSETSVSRFFSRRILFSPGFESGVLNNGSKIDVVSDYYLNYSVLLDEDLATPEFARLVVLIGASVILAVSKTSGSEEELSLLLDLYRRILGVTLIHVGYCIVQGDHYLLKAPTLIILGNGEKYSFSGDKPLLINIPLKLIKESKKREQSLKAELIFRILVRHYKKLRGLKTRSA